MFFRKGLRMLAAAISVSCILAGACMVLTVSDGYREGERKYRLWEETYTKKQKEEKDNKKRGNSTVSEAENPCFTSDLPKRMRIDFEGLKTVNTDIIGWIDLPAVHISYPLVQGRDNEYYLHRSLDRDYLFAGCLFLDADNSSEFQDENSIIYGHNMRDGSMFAGLKEYGKEEIMQICPYFWIYTPDCDYLYQVYSVSIVSGDSDAFRKEFQDSYSCMEWMKQQRERSVTETSELFLFSNRTVTLSTCTSDPAGRQIVQGCCILSMMPGADSDCIY